MTWAQQVAVAFLLDLLLGDPRWLPHPVRGIGWLASRLETATRRRFRSPSVAGVCAAAGVLGTATLAAVLLVLGAGALHPWLGDAVGVVLIYTTVAARDLARHSRAVYAALAAGNMAEGRRRVGMIVGRDTEGLDESEIVRAAVESVAESIVDGVTAPLFFAFLLGPVGAIAYRAVNTMDSMFGYRNERYAEFGCLAARMDDAANWIPARLTLPLIAAAAFLLRLRAGQALRIGLRDHACHPSPNSGWSEAALAGALGVQLGGTNVYGGVASEKPRIGEARAPLRSRHILLANRLMLTTSVLFVVCGAALAAVLGR